MKKKILIIEDNEALIKVLRLLLKRSYEVYLALNGEQGVAMANAKRPDLIIMDILLPGMDGLKATDIIRKNPNTRSIPILAITASVNGNGREECLQMGCNDFIPKPFTFEELLPRIEKLLPSPNGKELREPKAQVA
ncbi:MAG: response regulator [Deltaproteobacteria bacterium]|nr:response regulator [Deltaproteobacteria bacterium]